MSKTKYRTLTDSYVGLLIWNDGGGRGNGSAVYKVVGALVADRCAVSQPSADFTFGSDYGFAFVDFCPLNDFWTDPSLYTHQIASVTSWLPAHPSLTPSASHTLTPPYFTLGFFLSPPPHPRSGSISLSFSRYLSHLPFPNPHPHLRRFSDFSLFFNFTSHQLVVLLYTILHVFNVCRCPVRTTIR